MIKLKKFNPEKCINKMEDLNFRYSTLP